MWSDDLAASLPMATLAVALGRRVLGGVASGAAGFAFGLPPPSIWLHVIDPLHTTFLVVGLRRFRSRPDTIWPLRRVLDLRRLWPFLLAGVVGVPIGVWLLLRTDVGALKIALGVFLASMASMRCWRRGCRIVGAAAGRCGGRLHRRHPGRHRRLFRRRGRRSGRSFAAGRRRWRAASISRSSWSRMSRPCRLGTVALDRKALVLFALALPPLVLGAWVGWSIYGRLDETRFRQMSRGAADRLRPDPRALGHLPCSSIRRKSKRSPRRSTSAR